MATRNSGENFELKYDDEELYEDLLPLKKGLFDRLSVSDPHTHARTHAHTHTHAHNQLACTRTDVYARTHTLTYR